MSSNKRKIRKIFLLFALIFLTTVTFIFETYSWFVGITTVNVNQFSINVSTGDGLELSLDGSNWSSSNITIDPETIESIYTGNTNKWSNALEPVSTGGQIDGSSSKLNIFKKASLTPTAGGYKIVANKLSNTTTEEAGYIAFDMFIRNKTGSIGYETEYNADAAEDIYLTADSNAYVPTSGGTNYGLENSIRVGFFALGRTQVGATASTIRGLNCGSSPNLCDLNTSYSGYWAPQRIGVTWNIWEPNSAKHTSTLVNYFNQICKNRDETNGSYLNDSCFPLETGTSKRTYPILNTISSSDNIDIYDGTDVNGYMPYSKIRTATTYKTSYATSTGDLKPSLLKLAGNSITKVRVYIWLEGQDIDNYDLITQDQTINIKFGFTKDRYGLNTNNVNNPSTGRASSFADDSWAQIKANVVAGTTSAYNVGDTKSIIVKNGAEYVLRIVNKSTPSSCSNSSFSQTACDFVVEIMTRHENIGINLERVMNSSITNAGGWPGSELYTYVQGEFYNSLPSDLKDVIINTRVVSGHGSDESSNYTTNDKLFLLSWKEMLNISSGDSSSSLTRQLDYYQNAGVSQANCLKARKYNGYYYIYWLRSPHSSNNTSFSAINKDGYSVSQSTNVTHSYYPAFRIG